MSTDLRRTPLCDVHQELGARMVPFGGWFMPVQYSGLMEEHHAVRKQAGLFDVSHMGEVWVTGPQAESFLNFLTPNQVASLEDGQCHYTFLLNEKGTFIDDLLIYKYNNQKYFLVVNAGNQEKDFAWIQEKSKDYDVTVSYASDDFAQLAIQGPTAESILSDYLGQSLESIRYYWFAQFELFGEPAIVSRTGYTGEDGFEIYLPPKHAARLWRDLLEKGKDKGLIPCGLGARDTLRLEAKMALYGNDIDDTVTPLEAGLSWVLKMDKPNFIGKQALETQKENGIPQKLVCLEMVERGIARHDYPIEVDGQVVGKVTSGSHSPTLNQAIALGYVAKGYNKIGTEVDIVIRKKKARAKIVKGPFYKKNS